MKSNYFLNISYEEYFQKETLYGLIASLEKIDTYKDVIFNKINLGISDRITRLCSLKARINRANQIISSYLTANKGITMKSKFHYPKMDHSYYQSMYFEPNAIVTNPAVDDPINSNPTNTKEDLGDKPVNADNMLLHLEEIKQSMDTYKDIAHEITENVKKGWINMDKEMSNIDPVLEYCTSAFDFYRKNKITKSAPDVKEILQKEEPAAVTMDKKPIKKKVEIEDAPLTIGQKMDKTSQNFTIFQGTDDATNKYQFNAANNLGLGGVTLLDVHNNENEDEGLKKKVVPAFMVEDDNDDMENDFDDDVINMPLDNYIRNKSVFTKQKQQQQESNTGVSSASAISSVPSSVPTPPSSVPNPPSSVPTPPPSVPTPPPNVPSSVPKPPAGVPVPPPLTVNPPKAPTAPTVPSVPSVPSVPTPPPVQVVGAPIGGSVPPPPPLAIPKVDPALAHKRKEEAEKRAAAAPKKPEVKELSMHEQLALVKLKKVDLKEEAASKLIIILLYT